MPPKRIPRRKIQASNPRFPALADVQPKAAALPRLLTLRVVRKVLHKSMNWRLVRFSAELFDLQIVEVFLSLPQQTSTDLRDA